MKYRIERRGGVDILVDRRGCRPATAAERYFWRRLPARQKRTQKRKADPDRE